MSRPKVIKNFYPPMKDRGGMMQPAHDKVIMTDEPLPASITENMIHGGMMLGFHSPKSFEKNFKGSKTEKRK